jgi:hypothetical protein
MSLHHPVNQGVHRVDRFVKLTVQERYLLVDRHLSVLILVYKVIDGDCVMISTLSHVGIFKARLGEIDRIHYF